MLSHWQATRVDSGCSRPNNLHLAQISSHIDGISLSDSSLNLIPKGSSEYSILHVFVFCCSLNPEEDTSGKILTSSKAKKRNSRIYNSFGFTFEVQRASSLPSSTLWFLSLTEADSFNPSYPRFASQSKFHGSADARTNIAAIERVFLALSVG